MITGLEHQASAARLGIPEMTDALAGTAFQRYLTNLEGAVPSTADNPLPVGVDTGDLLGNAQLIRTNQYAFSMVNYSEHAGFIEDGTVHIAPRRPMQNAVDFLEEELQGSIDDVMTTVTRK